MSVLRAERLAWAAGLLPILAVNAAYFINAGSGSEACFPYLEGCQSVSRAVRSGPGLWLFKALALPSALAMAMTWWAVGLWLEGVAEVTRARRRTILWLGIMGAVFFLVYAAWLGTEGEVYRWLRRYGVVFYFAGTGLAQLVLVAGLWGLRRTLAGGRLYTPVMRLSWMVWVVWGLGVASAFKRKLIENPAFLDRVENALEWNFSLALSLAFLALASLLSGCGVRNRDRDA